MALDAINEYLENLAPPGAGPATGPYSMSRIQWQSTEGPRGVYEKSVDFNNPEHAALLKVLEAHKGKMRAQGYFLWVFEDKKTIARKKV